MHHRKLLMMIVIGASMIHTYGIRVDSKFEASTKASESANPKAEALTLVLHNFPPTQLRPIKVIDRSDDVVVIHTNRPKRKPTSRKRRPSPNQYRSKIKHPVSGSASSFGGFKDFSSNDYHSSDLRFPPFPTKNFGEPLRASNKYKKRSKPTDGYGFNAQPSKKRSKKRPPTSYGPPPTFSDFQAYSQQESRPLQTLQQQQTLFPTFTIDTVEQSKNNFLSNNEELPDASSNFDKFQNLNSNSDRYQQQSSYPGNFQQQSAHPGTSQQQSSNSDRFQQQSSNSDRFQQQSSNSDRFQQQSSNSDRFQKLNSNSDRFQQQSSNEKFPQPIKQSEKFAQHIANIDKFPQPFANNDKFPQPIGNFPLETGSTFNSQKTSYGSPIRNSKPVSGISFNSDIVTTNLNTNHNQNQNPLHNHNTNGNFPKLPSRYEPNDFSTPTRTNPIGNQFDYSSFNDVSESQNIQTGSKINRPNTNFNKFNNFDYEFGTYKDHKNIVPDDEDESDDDSNDYLFSARRTTTTTTTPAPTTTKRPKKIFGKRKRPAKISPNHNLDTEDLRDAFTESSDFHDVALSSDDFVNFDSQRQNKRSQNQYLHHEIHSTLKTARNQNNALRTALGDDFQILSVHKSVEKDPNEEDPFEFQRKSDDSFSVGSDLHFEAAAAPIMWNGDFNNFPRNHRFP